MTKLRRENQKLLTENKETRATLHSNIADLQKQMTETLTIALHKKVTLEAKLQEAERYILELESEREDAAAKERQFSVGTGLLDPPCKGEQTNSSTTSE